jgi:serine/threonine protein kinase
MGHYEIDRKIGTGAFGIVVVAKHLRTDEVVAIKIVARSILREESILATFEQECRIHASLCHENIVRLREILYCEDSIGIVLDFCEGGDLLDLVQSGSYVSQKQMFNIFYQIVKGVQYLHHRGIAHLDLKPENIFLTQDRTVKIGDFGCCQERPAHSSFNITRGTPAFSAPEMFIAPNKDNRPADVWSLGILLAAMSCGFSRCPDALGQLLKELFLGKHEFSFWFPAKVLAFVHACCEIDPAKRPPVDKLLDMPVLEDANDAPAFDSARPRPAVRFSRSIGPARRALIVRPSLELGESSQIRTMRSDPVKIRLPRR